jgi:hypothetical protein
MYLLQNQQNSRNREGMRSVTVKMLLDVRSPWLVLENGATPIFAV